LPLQSTVVPSTTFTDPSEQLSTRVNLCIF
jgi:hypothetical protein